MSDTTEVVLRELGQTLSALHAFLLEEEGVLVGGTVGCVQSTLCQREVFLAHIEDLSRRYQLLPAQDGEVQQQLIQDIKRQASAVAYQNRVNAQILHLRRAESSAAMRVFPRWVAQEPPLYSQNGQYIYVGTQGTWGPSSGR